MIARPPSTLREPSTAWVSPLATNDPALTATVSGLFGDDTVEYTLSRAAGEAPGTYAITGSGDATQGNYAVTYEPGTFTIEELELFQRSIGECKAIDADVPITDELIEALGLDSQSEISATAVADAMNQVDPNGLYRWENIVTGTDTNQVLLSTAVDSSAGAVSIAISRNEGQGKMADLGYLVLQDLRRYTNNVWSRIAGPSDEKTPSFTIQMTDAGGNSLNAAGYYRVFTLLVPKSDLSITNELPSTNIVGVLEVDSSLKDTMTAVPWNALANDPADPHNITVEGYMTPSQLAAGDSIYALNASGVYEKWTLQGPTRGKASPTWNPVLTVVDTGDEESVGLLSATPSAEERELERDNAVWVERENDTSKPYFLVGQYSRNDIQVTIKAADGTRKGATMVPNPTLTPMKINDYNWGDNPISGDVITIPGVPNLSWSAKKKQWTRSVQRADPVTGLPVRETITDDEIPSGQSFWYYRKGTMPFTITISVEKVD